MAVHASDLVTLAVAKEMIHSPNEDDAEIQRIITAASQAINKHCSGRLLKARDLVEIYDGDNDAQLFVDNYPINSIASIHQDTTRIFAAGSLVAATKYLIDKDLRRIWNIDTYWVNGLQTIQVTYNAGYNSIPDDLQLATLIVVDVWYKSFQDHRFGVTGVSIGDRTISYESSLPKQAKNMLGFYINRIIN